MERFEKSGGMDYLEDLQNIVNIDIVSYVQDILKTFFTIET